MPEMENSLEVRKGLLAPLEEGVAFHVAVVFDVEVHVEGITAGAGNIHLHRMVDDQIHGHLGLTFSGSPPISTMASRSAAKSTTAGTPVKSWRMRERGGRGSRLAHRPASTLRFYGCHLQ